MSLDPLKGLRKLEEPEELPVRQLMLTSPASGLCGRAGAHFSIIKQLRRHVSCGPAGDYHADEQALIT